MKRLSTSSLIALALAAACHSSLVAAPLPPPPVPQQELSQAVRGCTIEQDHFAAETQQLEHNTAPFGKLADFKFDPNSPMPEAPEGHSAVVADGGLLFDSARSALSYIGNVRLNDSHLQLRAAHSLYVRLPKHGDKKTAAPEQNPPAAQQKPADKPKGHTPNGASPTRGQKTIAPPPVPEPLIEDKSGVSDEAPGYITAENVAIDLMDSKFLLEGRRNRPSLSLTRGQDSISLDTQPTGIGAKIFGSDQGDVLFQGRNIVFTWHDSAGEEWKLVAATGPVYYKADQHCLVAMGDTRITSPRQSLHAKRAIYIVLAPEEQPAHAAEKKGSFSQFSSMRFKDVEYMNAYGDVHLTGAAEQGRPASSARGEALQYIAASGECRIYGEPCSFAYGDYTLQTNGCVELLGDGNATVQGSEITGEYERPFATSPKGQETIRGTYKAAGPITYDAQKNSVLLPGGLSAQDAHGFFTCAGAVEIFLAAKPQPAKAQSTTKRRSMRMPNLAIARQSDISRLIARGGIKMHSDASATEPAYDLSCDELEADATTASATLRAFQGSKVKARYGDYELSALASAKGSAEVKLLENGDLLSTGKQVHASLPGEKGATTATCAERLLLQREQNLLTLGKNSRITTPDAIMTANEPLQAILTPGEKAPQAPAKYPHLVYNFSGLHRATTSAGGTLRTAQASMQCEGLIEIELKPGAQMKGAADVRQNIQVATATGKVQVAGKDATGRLLRGEGDRLDFDSATGSFHMRGKSVVLVDEFNTHTATGKGACITIDSQNNVTISGEKQITSANHIHRQMENQKKQKK